MDFVKIQVGSEQERLNGRLSPICYQRSSGCEKIELWANLHGIDARIRVKTRVLFSKNIITRAVDMRTLGIFEILKFIIMPL